MSDLPAKRTAVEVEILWLTRWLLDQPDIWEDHKLRLRQLLDHFDGRWSERNYSEESPRVTLKRGRRKVPVQLSKFKHLQDAIKADLNISRVLAKRRGSNLRRRPDSVELLAYGNRVFLMVHNLSTIKKCPQDVLVRADRLREALDVIDVTLRLGGKVVG